MKGFFEKIIFLKEKPKLIGVAGERIKLAERLVFFLLENKINLVRKISPKIFRKKGVVFFSVSEEKEAKKLKFFLKRASNPIITVISLKEIPADSTIFASEKKEWLEKLIKLLPPFGILILNYDDETIRSLGEKLNVKRVFFGFEKGADFQITELNYSLGGANFKLNFGGNILPIWLKSCCGKRNLYSCVLALVFGYLLGFNLVELSQRLISFEAKEGEGKIEKKHGIYFIEDFFEENAFSQIEMLKILKEIGKERRKIAVLGDIVGIGKYTIEAHEAIGKEACACGDIIVTVGPRARFIAKSARESGKEKVFEFLEKTKAISFLKNILSKNDLVLLAGSKEMNFSEIFKAI